MVIKTSVSDRIKCGWLTITLLIPLAWTLPKYDYGGKSPQQFLTSALERSSPGTARILAELFGGLELGIDLGSGTQAVISVGGASTQCQHQSPCYDTYCQLCYDPLLRIHGKCGGASYFTCRGTLPKGCLPFSCTARSGRVFSPEKLKTAVFVKKFPKFQDPFCIERSQRARSLSLEAGVNDSVSSLNYHPRDMSTGTIEDPSWVMHVPDAITPCQGFDICLDLRCVKCYDPYLGAHTTCGKMTYYDCESSLPKECKPFKCTESNIRELFPTTRSKGTKDESDEDILENEAFVDDEAEDDSPLMVRDFGPMQEGNINCV